MNTICILSEVGKPDRPSHEGCFNVFWQQEGQSHLVWQMYWEGECDSLLK